MRSLLAHDIVAIWEEGLAQHPLDRALTILLTAFPEFTWDQMAELTIYQRDTFLSYVQKRTFGPSLPGFVECPQCKEQLAVTLSTETLFAGQETKGAARGKALELIDGDVRLKFRFPNSHDLAAIAGCRDMQTARITLASRCLVEATREGRPVAEKNLSNEIVDHLSERMAESEQNGEILLNICCPDCSSTWDNLVDIATFLWTNISSQAKRLLREVHILAGAYGWREEDILAMSPARRQLYLEMTT